MKILGIETSADDTGIALIEADGDPGEHSQNYFQFQILGNALNSQSRIHAKYGGIYPNVAKSEHQKNLVPLLSQT